MMRLAGVGTCFLSLWVVSTSTQAIPAGLSLMQLRAEPLRAPAREEAVDELEGEEFVWDSDEEWDWAPGPFRAAAPPPPGTSESRNPAATVTETAATVTEPEEDSAATSTSTAKTFPTDDMTAFGSVKDSTTGSIVVGFGYQKCATTFVSTLLRDPQHNVNTHNKKELHYIVRRTPEDGHHKESDEMKASHCARTTQSNGEVSMDSYINDCFGRYPKAGEMTYDFTPDYAAPENVDDFAKSASGMLQPARQHGADMRFLAMLRNPVERAISELDMKRKRGQLVATDEEMDATMANHVKMASERWTNSYNGYPTLLTFGEYNQSLAVLMSALPKESVLIVNSAKLSEQATWKRIYAHIGLDMPPTNQFQKMFDKNAKGVKLNSEGKYAASHVEKWVPSDDIVKQLQDYYKPFDEHLWKLIGAKWW